MNYVIYKSTSLAYFKAWSGGRDTLNTIIEHYDWYTVEDLIEEVFSDHTPSDVEINDFLWFERDTIANALGYETWEDYENERGGNESNEGEDA